MKILGLDHIALPVQNLNVSRRFYLSGLQLEEIERPDFSFPGAWFRFPDKRELHLIRRDTLEGIPRNSRDRHFAIKVDSVAAAARHLKTLELTFNAPQQRPDGVWQLFLRDPDLHHIELTSLEM